MGSHTIISMRKKTTTYSKIRLGENLRQHREQQDVSLRRLGLMTGVDYQYISLIEKGEANVTVDTLEKIADALGVPIRELF